jgi:hypothetical protein
MDILQGTFIFALLLCVAYGSWAGGKTGKAGSAIFIAATALTAAGAMLNPTWASTSYAVFAVDSGCLLLLAALWQRISRPSGYPISCPRPIKRYCRSGAYQYCG